MKLILSPSRNMKEYKTDIIGSKPVFEKETLFLSGKLKEYSPWDLESVLKANEKIAYKAFVNIQEYNSNKPGTPALFAYDGLVYKNIDPARLSRQAMKNAAGSLRIISAFYGLLGPFDYILPYRLEMQSKINIGGSDLYEFWGNKLHLELYKNDTCVINLASEEYAKAVRKHLRPCDRFVDIIFCRMVKGRRKVVTTTAKMARGQMAGHILENGIANPEALKNFEWDGYGYRHELSLPDKYVFQQE